MLMIWEQNIEKKAEELDKKVIQQDWLGLALIKILHRGESFSKSVFMVKEEGSCLKNKKG